MHKIILRIMIISILLVAVSSACSSKELPETFVSSINNFIVTGSKLNAATSEGLNYLNYQDYYADVLGAFDLTSATWPEEFAPEAKDQFTQAIIGWRLASVLWDAKLKHIEISTRSKHNEDLEQYAGDYLVKVGPRFQVSDANIGTILAMAGEQFEAGRDLILPELE